MGANTDREAYTSLFVDFSPLFCMLHEETFLTREASGVMPAALSAGFAFRLFGA
jgi:hypothetical protein